MYNMSEEEFSEPSVLADCSENDETYYPSENSDISNENEAEGIARYSKQGSISSSNSSKEEGTQNPEQKESLVEDDENDLEEPQKKRMRKRKRNEMEWQATKRKLNRNRGDQYISTTGKTISTKKDIAPFVHHCRYKCQTFTEIRRQEINAMYWGTGLWQQQTNFIRSNVSVVTPKRPKQNAANPRKKSTVIKLDQKRVCKDFFLWTLNISNTRFTNAVFTETLHEGLSPIYNRGRHEPGNKTNADSIAKVCLHINSFPKFHSHYSRVHNPNKLYLAPDLNVAKMYELYLSKCNDEYKVKPVSIDVYRQVFNTKFNLGFYKLKKDTCNTCDSLSASIQGTTDMSEKQSLKIELEIHHRRVQQAKECKDSDIQKAKQRDDLVTITFDLQKTLPTPCIPTNQVYYKRQLWTYNFGIHDCKSGKATMNMWSEDIAGRGASEIGSCLIKYVSSLSDNIKHIIAYSDSCGGQNRNYTIAKTWFFILRTTQIVLIDHKFLVPGHSFLENDTDFAHIERKKKTTQHIYVPDHWMEMVAKVQPKKFSVVKMKTDNFVSTKPIDDVLINRKVDVNGQKISWLKMRWMQFRKSDMKRLYFKETLSDMASDFFEVDLSRKNKSGECDLPCMLPKLRNSPVPIKTEKMKDLLSLLKFIPPIHHKYYEQLCEKVAVCPKPSRGRPKKKEKKIDNGSLSDEEYYLDEVLEEYEDDDLNPEI